MINYSCWILTRCYLFTCIVVIHILLIDTSNWLCISFFLQSNELIWWMFGMNVDTRKVWISYKIITVGCIRIFWFTTFDIWGNISTSPVLINVQNITSLFPSWRRKHHLSLFYFCNELSQYNRNENWTLIRCSMSWTSIFDRTRDKYNDWMNVL